MAMRKSKSAERTLMLDEEWGENPAEREVGNDYAEHLRTFGSFTHIVKWALGHFTLLLLGLYFAVLGGLAWFGIALILIAIGVLIYGVVSAGRSGREAELLLAETPKAHEEISASHP